MLKQPSLMGTVSPVAHSPRETCELWSISCWAPCQLAAPHSSLHPMLAQQGCSPGRSPRRRALSLPVNGPPAIATMRRARWSPARRGAPRSSHLRWSAPSRPTLEGGPKRCVLEWDGEWCLGERWLIKSGPLQGGRSLGGVYETFSVPWVLEGWGSMMVVNRRR